MRARVLGSAAGGGLPQWNCNCANCADARDGRNEVAPRTQSSIAVSADGTAWVLFNVSPDVRAQLEAFPPLHPRSLRESAVAAVVLTDAELDHTAGLLLLREGRELALYGTDFVRRALEANGMLPTLDAYLTVRWTELVPGTPVELLGSGGRRLGLEVEAFEVAGHPPLYVQGDGRRAAPGGVRAADVPLATSSGKQAAEVPAGHTIGVRIREPNGGGSLFYVPGAAAADERILARIGPGDAILWDGTLWTDDELLRMGISERRAADMGHLPISGPGGSLEALAGVNGVRKAFIHLNNTNPVLREGSPERKTAEAAGWEVAYDGMELQL